MAGDFQITVDGLDEFRRDLRRVNPQLGKTLQVAHKLIATRVADQIRPAVRALPSPGGSRAAPGVTPRATQKDARIAFSRAKNRQPLWANILGANTHMVFGRRRPVSVLKRRVWQPHIGNRWKPEDLYGAGPVIKRAHETFAVDEYEEAFMTAAQTAFPE